MSDHLIELSESRDTKVADVRVRRALPTKGRRTVGAWCFVDHMGPETLNPDRSIDVAPHPHMGLHTVTWLFSGEFLHRDSLGSEQLIRPGQLNLMKSGHGVAHSEENPGLTSGELHGMQLWVAQPSSTRDGPAAFAHFAELPRFESSALTGTVLVGFFGGVRSPARFDSEIVGVELELRDSATIELDASFEYALIVANGAVTLEETEVRPGELAYLGTGRNECRLESKETSRAMLIGGVPFDERLFMWWNFVARTQQEIADAWRSWSRDDDRFGQVASRFARIDVEPPPWLLSVS